MLHDSRNENIVAIAYAVDFHFLANQIFVDKNRMLLNVPVDNGHKLNDIAVIDRNLHTLTAQNIGRTHKNRIPQLIGRLDCFFCRKYGRSGRTRNFTLLKDFIKTFSVLGRIHIVRTCTENRHTHFHDGFRQLDGCLTAELNDGAVRFFQTDNIFHILRRQRFKIKLICNIEIRTYRFRIVIDDDRLITCVSQRPHTVYGTIIELDTLADPDRSGTKDNDLFAHVISRLHLILAAKAGIIIWCF